MNLKHEAWFDEAAGPLVRPYAVAGGRTRPTRHDLEMITLVVAMTTEPDPTMGPEYAQILKLCQRPVSVAEVSALLDLPLVVVKVLISDLIDQGYVIFQSPPQSSDIPKTELLQAVLDGIRKL